MIPQTPFKRLVLRAVLRDVYPMIIRLIAVPDFLTLTDFDDLFHALLGWESGAGYAFRLHGQQFNSLRRQTKSKQLSDFRLHRQERFLYTLGFMDQWEWEMRVLDSQDGTEGDARPVCLEGRGGDAATVLWRSDRILPDAQAAGTTRTDGFACRTRSRD